MERPIHQAPVVACSSLLAPNVSNYTNIAQQMRCSVVSCQPESKPLPVTSCTGPLLRRPGPQATGLLGPGSSMIEPPSHWSGGRSAAGLLGPDLAHRDTAASSSASLSGLEPQC